MDIVFDNQKDEALEKKIPELEKSVPEFINSFDDDIAYLKKINSIIFPLYKEVAVAPTYIPTNAREQIVLFNDGADFKLYIYIDSDWKSVALT